MVPNFLTMSLDMVTVCVGEADAAVNIPVYRDLLSAVSPYFRGAFEGSFKEAADRLVPLTDVSEQTFRIFLQWANIQMDSHSNGASVPAQAILLGKPVTEPAVKSTTALALDEHNYPHESMDEKEVGRLYHQNPEWLGNYQSMLASFLRLYVFADKYNIPQLRDDVLTALVTNSRTWKWWPDPYQDLIEFAYANLPQSSKFIRFLVLSVAYLWVSPYEDNSTIRLNELKEMHKDFAFDVIMVQVERYRDKIWPKAKDGTPFYWKETVPHSCILHEHRGRNEEQCRKRLRDHPYIFTTLIHACVKDALSIKEWRNEA